MMRSMSGSNEWDSRPTGITNTFYPLQCDENDERMNEWKDKVLITNLTRSVLFGKNKFTNDSFLNMKRFHYKTL